MKYRSEFKLAYPFAVYVTFPVPIHLWIKDSIFDALFI